MRQAYIIPTQRMFDTTKFAENAVAAARRCEATIHGIKGEDSEDFYSIVIDIEAPDYHDPNDDSIGLEVNVDGFAHVLAELVDPKYPMVQRIDNMVLDGIDMQPFWPSHCRLTDTH